MLYGAARLHANPVLQSQDVRHDRVDRRQKGCIHQRLQLEVQSAEHIGVASGGLKYGQPGHRQQCNLGAAQKACYPQRAASTAREGVLAMISGMRIR